ncbi:DUF4123 domain-containing protein [Photobacterium damselae]|uniref:DUF4123 domain-containing protein n=1 Tax=Photobacterium damselae TaxID=38293 RepID=UPI0015935271|nr:DUF4123 domain-containing protein [Photobacterium damselae]NVH49650.1 DUF4123 domain-containing protein [Photobacterium damselae subsp. damselae]NVO82198.1 DUF4123 domain-containing protein [Photobacterium damselae subsp. damselae]
MSNLYAVIDGAKIDKLCLILEKMNVKFAPIPPEPIDDTIREYLPYMVECNDELTRWLGGLALQWGLYFSGDVSFVIAKKHFRNLLKIKIDGHINYFRFYESEYLEIVWSVLTDGQKRTFMGPFDEVISANATSFSISKSEHFAPIIHLSQEDIDAISEKKSEAIERFIVHKIRVLESITETDEVKNVIYYLITMGLTNQNLLYDVCCYVFKHHLNQGEQYKTVFSPSENETATYRAESVLMGLC